MDNHDSFSSTVAATNSNLSRLSKTVASTASSLMGSSYGDLSNTHYQKAMNEIARRPTFQKRLFSFNARRTPSELVKTSLSKSEIQYRAVTSIPDELLYSIPPKEGEGRFSLYQGFKAMEEDRVGDDEEEEELPQNLLSDKAHDHHHHPNRRRKHDPVVDVATLDKKGLCAEKLRLGHRLDLLEVRKDLAANEIKEIDERIARLKAMRDIVFGRVADLEQEEMQLENQLDMVSSRLAEFEDLLLSESEEDESTRPQPASESSPVANPSQTQLDQSNNNMTMSPVGSTEAGGRRRLRRHTHQSRKTAPTLQQYYTPGQNIRMIDAHKDSITCLDFDIPFGNMVSASMDDVVTVWDLSKGKALRNLDGHKASVKCLQMDNNIVATGSADATVKIWDLAAIDDPYVDTFAAHLGEITALHFDSENLLTGSADKTIRQWDLHTGRCLQTLDVLWTSAQSVHGLVGGAGARVNGNVPRYDSDAPFVGALQCFDAALATGTSDGVVRLWDLRTGQVVRTLVGHTGPVSCLQFDDVHLATGSWDRSIRTWDLRAGTLFDAFAYDAPITSLHFDARRIVSANGQNNVKVYDREQEKHWTIGDGINAPDTVIDHVRYREGYLVEGRQNGQIGVWAC